MIPVPIDLGAFAGGWHIARRIEDARGPDGSFAGQALFTPDAAGLTYTETGILRLGDTAFQADRRYLWRPDPPPEAVPDTAAPAPARIAVLFADGRPFHSFDLGPTASAHHGCDPDSYAVTYDFTDWPCWTSRWQVTGPRKDYVMTTQYRRVG